MMMRESSDLGPPAYHSIYCASRKKLCRGVGSIICIGNINGHLAWYKSTIVSTLLYNSNYCFENSNKQKLWICYQHQKQALLQTVEVFKLILCATMIDMSLLRPSDKCIPLSLPLGFLSQHYYSDWSQLRQRMKLITKKIKEKSRWHN